MAKKTDPFPRDENGIPCTCREQRTAGKPEDHDVECPWALAQLDSEDMDLDDLTDLEDEPDETIDELWEC